MLQSAFKINIKRNERGESRMLRKLIAKLNSNRFFKHGAPLILFCVGGSLALREFGQIRYDVLAYKTKTEATPELKAAIKRGTQDESFDLNEEYLKMKNEEPQDWKNIRGPRPWESDNKEYIEVIQQRIAEEMKKDPSKRRIIQTANYNQTP